LIILYLDRDLQQLVNDEIRNDGIINATQQQQLNNTPKLNFINTDIHGKFIFCANFCFLIKCLF
jgi:hypothetical protein